MLYPTLAEVEQASIVQLARWFRFLPLADNEQELKISNTVVDKFYEKGGMTPEISKHIGWDE